MTRDWKPGDVALVTWNQGRFGGRDVAIKARVGWRTTFDLANDDVTEARPLVVIDPEDREQIGQFANLIATCGEERHHCEQYPCGSLSCWTDRLADALREFANPTPPKPEEPQGLGAVVVDADNLAWVRWTGDSQKYPWCAADDTEGDRAYADIDAVRVLSEGWTA